MPSGWPERASNYEIHAYLFFEFRCVDCEASAPVASEFEQATEEWCSDVARQAQVAGWVLPPDYDETGELDRRCYCPPCAERRGLAPAF